MTTFDIFAGSDSYEVEAEYYQIEDGFLTLKDASHKQVASFNVNTLVSIARVTTKPTTVGTATVTIVPTIDQAAFEKAVVDAVEKAERAAEKSHTP